MAGAFTAAVSSPAASLDAFRRPHNFRHQPAVAGIPLPRRRRFQLSVRALMEVDPREPLELSYTAPDAESPMLSREAWASEVKRKFHLRRMITVERPKAELLHKTTFTGPVLETDGDGGDIGKKNIHGGGDGGDDGGDDDDYFGDFDEGDEGDEGGFFRSRLLFRELFDRKFVDAVLQEWGKSMANLPEGLRQAYQMGLVSSAQMVRFLTINARPNISRTLARALPQSLSRAFIGRMLADPLFLYKLLLEQAAAIGCSIWWELKNRKKRIKQEWDLAVLNVLTVSACNAFAVWSLAPCRSYGNTFRYELQNTIQKLPNNLFEQSYPLREFDMQKRIYSFFYKAAEFFLVGLTAGSIQGGLSKLSAKNKGGLSVNIPTVSNNALGYGAFLGLYAHMRYQLLCGIDRAMFNYFDALGVIIFFSTAMRVLNVQIGEVSRWAWLGIEKDSLHQSDTLLKTYTWSSESAEQSSGRWFISKNAIMSGLALLGIKQGNGDAHTTPTKARTKRAVRRKISTSV